MKSPFEIIDNKMHCSCGNNSDSKLGFHTKVINAFASSDESETETTVFKMSLVPMNVCNECGISWPIGQIPKE